MHKNARKKLIFLRRILIEHFDEGELRTLCFDLGVDYEGFPGSGKEAKARELIAFVYRRGRIGELITVGQDLRPDVPWPVAGGVRKRFLVIVGILIIALASVAVFVFEMFRPENQNSIQHATPAPPLSNRVVFVSDRTGNYEIYIASFDSSLPVALTNHPAGDYNPTWSPDGQHIAFHTGDSPNRDIFYVNDDGSSRNSLIIDRSDDFWPAWSPLEVTP